ncbi:MULTISPECIES: zinc ribbon domain-containing protein [Bacillus]|uniref:zinc ribbon domain-containing protein n=1 Tax=Bacillus TaxID=1386 RepID=UPI001F595C79|nr:MULTISPECIES: zinc ribbon domain-containing protein [Bacillus]MDX9638116.1 zinc ribbon domain-containing protein [Bacillus sp. PBL-C9]
MIICNNCGEKCSENNKFCGECGTKLTIPQNVLFQKQQKRHIENINNNKKDFISAIEAKLILDNKDSFKVKYQNYLKSIKETLDFLNHNTDYILDLFFKNQKDEENKLQQIEFLQEKTYFWDIRSAYYKYIKENQNKQQIEKFIQTYLEEKITYYSNRAQSNMNDAEETLNENERALWTKQADDFLQLLQKYKPLVYLHEKGELLQLIEASGEPVVNSKNVHGSSSHQIHKHTSAENDTLDLLDVADAALALSSPISAARYIIKQLKNNQA